MNPALTQLQTILEYGKSQLVSKDEMRVFLEAVVKLLRDFTEKHQSQTAALLSTAESLKADIGKKSKATEEINREAQALLRKVQTMIPEVPDLTPYENRLISLESVQHPTAEEIQKMIPKDTTLQLTELKKTIEAQSKEITALKNRPINGKAGGKKGMIVRSHNLSSYTDGVTKTFTLPIDTVRVLGVWGTQFPITFNENVDWTFAGRTLTLTSAVSAPASGQTLFALIEVLFY